MNRQNKKLSHFLFCFYIFNWFSARYQDFSFGNISLFWTPRTERDPIEVL